MATTRPNRVPARGWVFAFCTALALPGCASSYVLAPPRLDLEPHGRVALVTFEAGPGNERMAAYATERFAEIALANQPGVEVVELDGDDLGLSGPMAENDGQAIADAVKRVHDVSAVFVGDLALSGVKTSGGLGSAGDARVGASVEADLAVRLVSVRSGGTLWRGRGGAVAGVGQARTGGGLPSVSFRDPSEAYDEAVNEAVVLATRDLRPTRVRE